MLSDKSRKDGYVFRCSKCRSKKCIRKGSFFEDARLSIPQIMYITYCWAAELSVKSAVHISDVIARPCHSGASSTYEKCAARSWFSPITTASEVQESLCKFMKVLLPRGSRTSEESSISNGFSANTTTKQNWDTSSWSMTAQHQHSFPSSASLWGLAARHFSDKWPAYGQLANMGYQHQTVNHSESFIDPTTGACTNAIEAYWSRMKRHVKLHWLSDRDQLPLRIDELLWRDRHWKKCNDVFFDTIRLMANH